MFGIVDLYSKGNRPQPAISYGPMPSGLKIQIVYIFRDFISDENISDTYDYSRHIGTEIWHFIKKVIQREHMVRELSRGWNLTSEEEVCNYFESLIKVENELDILQLTCQTIDSISKERNVSFRYAPGKALSDINVRLQEHGIGYRYQAGKIIKVPSEFTYEQVITPALVLLHHVGFENAQQEFVDAFEHYKKGPTEYEAALTACLKAVESTIKIIATARGWTFNQTDTAKPLISLLLKEGFIPAYSESFLAGVRNTLESGIPTLRNKLGGHGKGAETRVVDEASMHYCINLTAAVILYLAQRHQELH